MYFSFQSYHWAAKLCSEASIAKVQHLCESNHLPRDALLEILACAVERNPCESKRWVRLAQALGDVKLTRNVQFQEKSEWWGKQRATEWENQFFLAPKSTTHVVKPEFVRTVSVAIDPLVGQAGPSLIAKEQTGKKSFKETAISMPKPQECMGWIWSPADDNCVKDEVSGVSTDEAFLPANTSNIEFDSHNESLFDSETHQRFSGNTFCEALCLKTVVACHLLGARHPFVQNSVWWLSVKLWQSTQAADMRKPTNSFEYRDGLAWLTMYGVDIRMHLHCRLNHSLNIKSRIKEEQEMQEVQHSFFEKSNQRLNMKQQMSQEEHYF